MKESLLKRESVEAFKKAIEVMKFAKLGQDQKLNNIEELKINIKNADKIPQFKSEESYDSTLDIIKEHDELEDFSAKLSVKYSDDRGRYSVANELIEPGEVICKTKPVSSIIYFDKTLEYCYNCLSHCVSVIPCTKCSSTVFCSFECRQNSKERHERDCPLSFLDIYINHGSWGVGATSVTFLALKVIGMRPAQFYIDHCATFDIPEEKGLPLSDENFGHLNVLFNSVTHLPTTKDQLQKIFMSVFLFQCLQNVSYFQDINTKQIEDYFQDARKSWKVFFTSLIFHFMLAIYSNCHCISSSTPDHFKREKYGLAVFARVVSLLNHSCNPNTGIVIKKDQQVTIATKRIQPGDEICHIYQGHFADTNLVGRRKLMQDFFHFTCSCVACQEDWPLLEQLGEEKFEHERYQSLNSELISAFDEKNYARAMQVAIEKCKIVSDCLQEPHRLYVKDRAMLLECLWQLYANKSCVQF